MLITMPCPSTGGGERACYSSTANAAWHAVTNLGLINLIICLSSSPSPIFGLS